MMVDIEEYFLPVFHFNILGQFAAIISEKTEIKCIEEKIAENPMKVIDIIPFMRKITFDFRYM